MKSNRVFLSCFLLVLLNGAAAQAAGVDMKDPRRALGREDDVRIDAQLLRDTVGPGAPIVIRWQIQNLSAAPVAVASRESHASYDEETSTITVSIGCEVPGDGNFPVMTLVAPGATRAFAMSVSAAIPAGSRTVRGRTPRAVQVKVSILRNLDPFAAAIQQQQVPGRTVVRLSDALFERWLDSNNTIVLNSIPVRYQAARRAGVDAETGGRPNRF